MPRDLDEARNILGKGGRVSCLAPFLYVHGETCTEGHGDPSFPGIVTIMCCAVLLPSSMLFLFINNFIMDRPVLKLLSDLTFVAARQAPTPLFRPQFQKRNLKRRGRMMKNLKKSDSFFKGKPATRSVGTERGAAPLVTVIAAQQDMARPSAPQPSPSDETA